MILDDDEMQEMVEELSEARSTTAIERILREFLSRPEPKEPVVNVTTPAPIVTVNPEVKVDMPRVRSWVFQVERDDEGLIEKITATPK